MASTDEEVCLKNNKKTKKHQKSSGKRKRRRCFYIVGCLFLLLLFAAFGVLVALLLVVGWQEPRVTTSIGTIDGLFDPDHHIFSFKGIPYALPPVKQLRWSAPKSINNDNKWWGDKPYEANNFAPQCAQFVHNTKAILGSEDCLYLNIFTPSLDPEKLLPTLVFLHGGFLHWGYANMPNYSPSDTTARELGVIVVSLQFRLNVFGFFTPDSKAPGNYGVMDILEALRWIRVNLHAFGGDPSKITVIGHDASASLLGAICLSHGSEKLFQQMWLISPPSGNIASPYTAAKYHQKIYVNSNCSDMDCLKRLDTFQVLSNFYLMEWSFANGTTDLPMKGVSSVPLLVMDGIFVTSTDHDTLFNSTVSNVTIIIGSVTEEIAGMPSAWERVNSDKFNKWTKDDSRGFLSSHYGPDMADNLMTLYESAANVSMDFMYASMVSDARFTCGVSKLKKRLGKCGAPVYRYVLGPMPYLKCSYSSLPWVDSMPSYAFHGIDLMSVFGGSTECDSWTTGNDGLAYFRDVIQSWLKFGPMTLPGWHPGSVALFAQSTQITGDTSNKKCDFWLTHFPDHSWRP